MYITTPTKKKKVRSSQSGRGVSATRLTDIIKLILLLCHWLLSLRKHVSGGPKRSLPLPVHYYTGSVRAEVWTSLATRLVLTVILTILGIWFEWFEASACGTWVPVRGAESIMLLRFGLAQFGLRNYAWPYSFRRQSLTVYLLGFWNLAFIFLKRNVKKKINHYLAKSQHLACHLMHKCSCERTVSFLCPRCIYCTMEAPTNGSSFGIDSLLSHRPVSPRVSTVRASTEDCRSPASSPGSELDSDCSSPASPRRESDPESPLVMSQPRTVTSSFLIRDILADCRPLAACAPYSNSGDSAREPEDYTDRLHSNSSSDSEYRGKRQKQLKDVWQKKIFG